jgi:hypothetical protein
MVPLPRRRHLRYVFRAGTWRHLGRRARWSRTSERGHRAVQLTWPVAHETSETIRIIWPNQYGLPNAHAWANPIKSGIAAHVPVVHADIVQPIGNVVLFHVVADGTTRRMVIDYDDRPLLHHSAEVADLYFKMQYLRDGYGSDAIVPGGYVSRQAALYKYVHSWRQLRDRSAPSHDVVGRFGMDWAQDIRGQAIAMLQAQDRVDFRGGAAAVWWGEYMDEICDARVCLDLPGNGEFCYRLVEYLAVGACIVGPELKTEMPVPLESGVHLVRVPRTLDGLIGWCEQLANDHDLRNRIRRGAEDYFDRYLSLEQLGAYYVDSIWRLVNKS